MKYMNKQVYKNIKQIKNTNFKNTEMQHKTKQWEKKKRRKKQCLMQFWIDNLIFAAFICDVCSDQLRGWEPKWSNR